MQRAAVGEFRDEGKRVGKFGSHRGEEFVIEFECLF